MSLFEKLFGSNKSEREPGGEPGQVSTEALPRQQYEDENLPMTKEYNPDEDLPMAKEYNPDEDLPMAIPVSERRPSSASAFRAQELAESRTAQEMKGESKGENIVDLNDYKKQKEALEEKVSSVKILHNFFKTAKENGVTDVFALGELATNQSDIDRINLGRAAEIIVGKQSQEELFEAAEIPKEDREALAEAASKIILISKSKVREKLRHLG